MKTNVSDTSIAAYRELAATGQLARSERQVFNAVQPGQDYTLRELKQITGMDINSVSGRVNALKTRGALVVSEKRLCTISGRTVTPVKRPDEAQ